MAKQKRIVPPRPMTKRQLSKWERERRLNRWLLTFGAIFLALVLAIPAFAYYTDVIARGNDLIARVNDRTFDMNYYMKLLRFRDFQLSQQLQFLQSLSGGGQDSTTAQFAQAQLQTLANQRSVLPMQVLEEVVENALIREGAAKLGLLASPAEVDEDIRNQFMPPEEQPPAANQQAQPTATDQQAQPTPLPTPRPTQDPARRQAEFEANFKGMLERTGLTDPDYRSIIAEVRVLRDKLNKQLQSQVPTSGEQVHINSIVVEKEEDAKDVLTKLQEGQGFSELAKEASKDSYKDQGGDMGWFPRGILGTDLEDAAFKLQAGQLSPVVNANGAFYILKVTEREANRPIAEERLSNLKNAALSTWLKSQKTDPTNKVERFFDSEKQIWAMKKITGGRQAGGL